MGVSHSGRGQHAGEIRFYIDDEVGSLAIIAASFPEQERGRAIGAWSGFSAMTTAIGPVVGGWLIDHWSWRWAFLLNLPMAVTTLVLLFWRVPLDS